jgi:hypothetical protein
VSREAISGSAALAFEAWSIDIPTPPALPFDLKPYYILFPAIALSIGETMAGILSRFSKKKNDHHLKGMKQERVQPAADSGQPISTMIS